VPSARNRWLKFQKYFYTFQQGITSIQKLFTNRTYFNNQIYWKRRKYEKDSKCLKIVYGWKTSDKENPYIEASRVPSASGSHRVGNFGILFVSSLQNDSLL